MGKMTNSLEKLRDFRVVNLHESRNENIQGIFDTSTPEGAFFAAVHKKGYSMYTLDEDGQVIYSELYDALSVKGNQVINAVAGAGKTTALVLKVLHDVVTGETLTVRDIGTGHKVRIVDSVWVCTFLRSGAMELKTAMSDWITQLKYNAGVCDGVSYSTMDAEFRRCLVSMGVTTPVGSVEALHKLFINAVNDVGITRQGKSLTKQDYRIISEIVTYVRGRLDAGRFMHPSVSDYGLTPVLLRQLIDDFALKRQKAGIMDFEEVMELLYKYLYTSPNPNVQDFVSNRYKYIYVDEFQDTSQIAYAILKYYASGVGKLVVVGDPSQCIYSFRGSDSRILKEYVIRDFNPTLSALSVNYRCPAGILDAVVPSIHKNSDSANQRIVASRGGGLLRAFQYGDLGAMADDLVVKVMEDAVQGKDVVILCRTNFDGVLPACSLALAGGLDFSISGEDMTLSSPLARTLVGFTQLFTEGWGTGAMSALKLLMSKNNEYALKKLGDVLRLNDLKLWEVDIRDVRESCPDLLDFLWYIRDDLDREYGSEDERDLELLSSIYSYIGRVVFGNTTMFSEQARGILDLYRMLLQKESVNSVYDFLDEISYLTDLLKGCVKKEKARVRIATVHEFKGKQADAVYIWNDSEGSFPSSKTDLQVLSQVEEERRVHYIACTRSKESLTLMALHGRAGLFAKEMPIKFQNGYFKIGGVL